MMKKPCSLQNLQHHQPRSILYLNQINRALQTSRSVLRSFPEVQVASLLLHLKPLQQLILLMWTSKAQGSSSRDGANFLRSTVSEVRLRVLQQLRQLQISKQPVKQLSQRPRRSSKVLPHHKGIQWLLSRSPMEKGSRSSMSASSGSFPFIGGSNRNSMVNLIPRGHVRNFEFCDSKFHISLRRPSGASFQARSSP